MPVIQAADLSAITESDLQRLRAGEPPGDRVATHLWHAVGLDFDTGIRQVASLVGLTESQVIETLAARAVREASMGERVRDRYFSALLLVVTLVLLCLLPLSLRAAAPVPLGLGGPVTVAVVSRSDQSLPAFHLIDAPDVDEQPVITLPGGFGSSPEVVGRYTLVALPAGVTIRREQLSQRCGAPAGAGVGDQQLLVLPVKAIALGRTEPGDCVTLLISPRQGSQLGPPATVVENATLLDVKMSGENASLTVAAAVSLEQRDALARLLGLSDVFVLKAPTALTR